MSDAVTGDPWVPVGVAGDVVDVAGPAAVGRPGTVDCTTPMSCAGGISGSRTASTTDTVLATVAAVLAACLIVIRFSFFLHLHLVRRDLSPVRNTVSDLGTGRSRREFTVMGALTAVAYVLVLLACQGQGTGPGVQLVILAAAIADMVVMLGFPTDLTGTGRTRSGRIHLILAVVQFTGIFVATVNLDFTPVLPAGLQEAMRWAVRVSFHVFFAALILPKLRRRWPGLAERVFLVVTLLWFLVVAVALGVA